MPIDYSRYPKNWKSEIVPRIIDRDKNCCKFCGVRNRSIVWSVGIELKFEGRYQIKKIWITSECDVERMRIFKHWQDPKAVQVILTVAHLDHDETNHDVSDERLAALCQYCHLNYDALEKYRRALGKST